MWNIKPIVESKIIVWNTYTKIVTKKQVNICPIDIRLQKIRLQKICSNISSTLRIDNVLCNSTVGVRRFKIKLDNIKGSFREYEIIF